MALIRPTQYYLITSVNAAHEHKFLVKAESAQHALELIKQTEPKNINFSAEESSDTTYWNTIQFSVVLLSKEIYQLC